MKILVTGTAGFIGHELAKKLLERGDVVSTFADVSRLIENFNYSPDTKLGDGIEKFIEWYRKFYKDEI